MYKYSLALQKPAAPDIIVISLSVYNRRPKIDLVWSFLLIFLLFLPIHTRRDPEYVALICSSEQ